MCENPNNFFMTLETEFLRDLPVYPITIPTPFAVGEVYSYLIKDKKVVLVDCGYKDKKAVDLIEQKMNEQGLKISDLDEIWLTHGHPDHFGLASRLVEEADARVVGHRGERANFACNDDGELFASFFEHQNIPAGHISEMVKQLDWLQQFQDYIVPEWLSEGDRLTAGSLDFRVKHTPGHAPGHLTFYSDRGIIFSGDVLLEHISTNALINFDPETGRRNKSLLQYRSSLEWIRNLKGIVLPGHGRFITNIEEVADHHLKNQQVRYSRIKNLLAEAPRSLFELSEEMFPDAIKNGAVFLVLSEVMGYLDWGMEEGKIEEDRGRFVLCE